MLPRSASRLFFASVRTVPTAAFILVMASGGQSIAADSPVDRFLAELDSLGRLPPDGRELIRSKWAQCSGCDPDEFLTQGLALMSERFRAGLDAYDADDFEGCARIMAELKGDRNRFLAVHAAAYEIKSLIAMDRMPEAHQNLVELTADNGESVERYSYFTPEMDFLRGFCLLADLQYDTAFHALRSFLARHEDGPDRLVIAAKQMLIELSNREEGKLGEVGDLMQYSQRRLKNSDTGETVQQRQDRIIELLDGLIKDAEDQEKQSCDNPSGGGSGQQGGSPSNPMQDSILPGGAPSEGTLRAGRRINPGEMWGAMPAAERERVLQALKERFPNRYRRLVEQYYEQLAKKP